MNMMNNLYVFAIGGSGERVVKSLVMMLTTGMKIGAQRIKPVFIDNDVDSKAFKTCCELITYYNATPQSDHKMGANTLYLQEDQDSATWGSFFHVPIDKPIVLNKAGEAIGNLRNVIGYTRGETAAHKSIEEEMNLLFTDDDLNMPLSVGFVGNPNIGSIVLNSLSLDGDGSTDFGKILANISANDGAIVIGSLFGGTGAAGLPLVINKLKSLPPAKKPILGGIAVLPYFNTDQQGDKHPDLDTKKWDVKSGSFVAKTRAALMYYDDYMKYDYDCLYYVGNSQELDTFHHCVGGEKQDNPYHIVEMMSALSVIDFSMATHLDKIEYKSPIWGFTDQNNSNVSGIYNSDLAKSLVKFRMLKEMFYSSGESFLKWAIDIRKDYCDRTGFNEPFRLSVCGQSSANSQAWGIANLFREFDKWMSELSSDRVSRPFLLFNSSAQNVNGDNITKEFYSERKEDEVNFGIAKSELKGFFKKTLAAVKADIANEMQNAYNQLYPGGIKQADTAKTLSILLKIISKALDNVLEKNCIEL